jgi:type IV secretory pathway VirB2 component (pilin)
MDDSAIEAAGCESGKRHIGGHGAMSTGGNMPHWTTYLFRYSYAVTAGMLITALFIGEALAAYQTPMGYVLCDIVNWIIYGNLGRGLATLAVIVVGCGAVLGKVSWGLAMTVAVGISVIFGAENILNMLGVTASC